MKIRPDLKQNPPLELILRVVSEGGNGRPPFCAGAVWVRSSATSWSCVLAAPILFWMVGATPKGVKQWIDNNQFKHEWVKNAP